MNRKAVSGIILVLMLIWVLTSAFDIQPSKAEPTTIIVPDNYPTIQEAINAANFGDTVYVRNGTYYENVVVNKTISLIGESKENTIVDGGGTWAVVAVEKDNVVVTGFTVRNSGSGWYYYEASGITIANSTFCNIYNNIATNVWYGITSWLGGNNSVSSNTISNADQGVSFDGPYHNRVISNSISNTSVGICLWANSYLTTVVNNTISNSSDVGIYLDNSPYGLVINNIIADSRYGIYMFHSVSNKIYHNSFLNNTQQAFLSYFSVGNSWDNGYPSGGNYWSDYLDADANEDGIGDTSYVIDGDNIDYYPLMKPWAQPWGDWSHYHNYTEIARTLIYLNETYPNIANVFSIGKSWQNKDIYCIRLTNETNTHPKPKLFFVGYHHARELISAELPLYFAVEAANTFGTNETITHMLNYSEIYIVPALNPDGFDAVKANEWHRKNVHPYDEDGDTLFDEDPPDDEDGDGYIEQLMFSNETFIRWEGIDNDTDGWLNEDWVGGVDLNRNYDYQWNATCYSGSPYPWAEDYRGPAPFSEPETQAIRDLALSHDFKYAISFHSGTEVIGYPWGYTNTPTPHDATFGEVAGNLSALVGAPCGQIGKYMYTTSGSWDDWMYGNRGTFALTCEIYTNNSAWQPEPGPDPDTLWIKGVSQFFNPDSNNIETVIQRWLPVFTYITNRAITEAYDIATTNMTPLKTVVGQGYSVKINVTVTNQGEFTETFNVTAYTRTTVTAKQAGLVGCWSFDEGSGAAAHDSSGNDNHGALYNGPAWVDGKSGKALNFDGFDDYVEVADSDSLDITGEITIEAWIKPKEYTHTGWVVSKSDAYYFALGSASMLNHVQFELQVDETTSYLTWSNGVINLNEWNHIAVTVNSTNNLIFYINGVQDTVRDGWAVYGVSGYNLKIGPRFNGTIDEVRIYNRSLTEEEIIANMQYYGKEIETREIETKIVTLSSRDSTTVAFTLNTTGVAKGNYTITAYAEPVLGETDTTDNTYVDGWIIVAMVGDLTGPEGVPDGKCDMRDVYVVARAFGTWPGHPRWNPNADITGPQGVPDEKVDMRDIFVVARNFGKTDP